MRILILEPHGDDALLSCNSILKTDNEIDILTFSDYRSSEGLKEYYSSVKYTKYLDNSNLWYSEGKFPWKTHEIHKDYNNGINVYHKFISRIQELFGSHYQDSIDHAKTSLLEEVHDLNKYDIVVCPVGIVHPYHLVINQMWNMVNKDYNIPTIYYADKYYIQNRYGKELYESAKSSMIDDYKEYNQGYNKLDTENSEIGEILCKVYPTEGKLLRFYSDIINNYPCKYLYKNNKITEELINELE